MTPSNEEVLSAWEEHLRFDDPRSPNTVRGYVGVVGMLSRRSGKSFFDMTIRDLQRERDSASTPASQRQRVVVLKLFFSWLSVAYSVANVASGLKAPKNPRILPKYLDDSEMRRLEKAARWRGPKDYALFCLLAYQAVRISEAAGLAWEDIDFRGGWINVRGGKGAKDRSIPLHTKTTRALKLWRVESSSEWVFPKRDGLRPTHPNTLTYTIKATAKEAGVPPSKVWPHKLRHTAATQLNSKGAALPFIQQFLGHENIATTMIYTHVKRADMPREHRKLKF